MYDIFYIGNHKITTRFPTAKSVESFEQAKQQSLTKMFWVVWPGIDIADDFDFSYKADDYSLDVTHVFRNGENYDGVCLFPKNVELHKREIDYRFFASKKEVDIIASNPCRYDIITVANYEEYTNKLSQTKSEFVYVVPSDITVRYNFEYAVPYKEKDLVHIFKNKLYNDGMFVQHRSKTISKREFEFCWYTNKKELDIIVSEPKPYDKFYVDSYEDYCDALEKSATDFLWIIPNSVDVLDTFNFDYQLPAWERDVIHVFKNGEHNDGIFVCHKDLKVAKREFEYYWFMKKNEVDVQASMPQPYDIVFISYQEPNADENYAELCERFPRAKRVHGVKGIHQAHIAAAKLCDTDMIWIVDGDAIIVDEFNFDYQVPKWQRDHVFVWRSQNPINDMVYGYGGIKLFPRKETINMDTSKPDMTTSISSKFNAVKEISNITAFNTGEFETWKSAFRECAKLSSKVIDRQKDNETNRRLDIWQSVGADRLYGEYSIAGAKAGSEYGLANQGNLEALKKINDFDWLQEQFENANI